MVIMWLNLKCSAASHFSVKIFPSLGDRNGVGGKLAVCCLISYVASSTAPLVCQHLGALSDKAFTHQEPLRGKEISGEPACSLRAPRFSLAS